MRDGEEWMFLYERHATKSKIKAELILASDI